MNVPTQYAVLNQAWLAEATEAACATIAPAWPLDRLIAVNPHWGRIGTHFEAVGARLRERTGSRLHMPLWYYRHAWERGEIAREDLYQAIQERGMANTKAMSAAMIDALHADDEANAPVSPLPLPSDLRDAGRDLRRAPAWRETITHQISQFCAAWFDRHQADWHLSHHGSLYAAWRATMMADRGVALLMHDDAPRQRAARLPHDAHALLAMVVQELGVPHTQWAVLFEVALSRIVGWASWCAWLRWEATLSGATKKADGENGEETGNNQGAEDADALLDLLAIRIAWEWLLDDGERAADSLHSRWLHAWAGVDARESLPAEHAAEGNLPVDAAVIWQRAQECAFQRQLIDTLMAKRMSSIPTDAASETPPAVRAQAVFCIDVRSEVFRRALEATAPNVRTLGFAGFFGLPLRWRPQGAATVLPLLPGLIAPVLEAGEGAAQSEVETDPHEAATEANPVALPAKGAGSRYRAQARSAMQWRAFRRLPASAFSMVESLGLFHLPGLLRRALAGSDSADAGLGVLREQGRAGLQLPALTPEQAAAMLADILRTMGLSRDFAPLVLLVGHGSRTANNPHAAGLQCGACGGQAGDINARTLAALLNDRANRRALADRGITISDATHFLPALHDTVTDEVALLDVAQVPSTHAQAVDWMRQQLVSAARLARKERAAALDVQADAPAGVLEKLLRMRGRDWAQTRPEWGLTNNAALVVAPRRITRGCDLAGRAFLHEYDAADDPDGIVLTRIMTAPMVVAHWINLQYFASTVDPLHYGSGNKLLHNVVGGRIGVFEGNGGDLRIGLPLQSVHDGSHWRHAPVRLTVVIAASRAAIDAVIAAQPTVAQLVKNRWLHLFRIEDGQMERYAAHGWESCTCGTPVAGC